MDDKTRREIIDEAMRIGDELLFIADHDEFGMSWNIMAIERDMTVTPGKIENIYNGVSGVVLFFLELYKQTREAAYLNACVEGTRWLEHYCQHNPSGFYSFLNGRMGVSYTLLQMYQVTKEERYLNKALSTASGCSGFFEDPRLVSNWINGASGTVLALLHLYTAAGEKWILEKIDLFIRYLIENTHPGPKGVYWDRSSNNISGLCGFANGASGVGFVFLELGKYFENDAFTWMAEQAFLYESCFFDDSIKNWRDLRKVFHKYEDYTKHEAAFLEGDLDFFTRGGDVNAWSHGAAGIGLCRLRAVEILDKPVYKKEAGHAVSKAIQSGIQAERQPPLFILAEGSGGHAELFLKSSTVLKDPHHLSLAENIALKALAYRKKYNRYVSALRYPGREGNASLFMGNPGIGYFYLRVLDPLNVPSILMPEVNAGTASWEKLFYSFPHISISLPEIKKRVIKRYFKRSIVVGESCFPQQLEDFLERNEPPYEDKDKPPFKDRFCNFLEEAISSLPGKQQKCMADIAALETEKKGMDEQIKSHHLVFIEERIQQQEVEKVKSMERSQLMDLKLVLNPNSRFHYCQWNWDLAEGSQGWLQNLKLKPGHVIILLKATPFGIVENTLSPFAYVVLSEFRVEKRVKDVIHSIMKSFEISSGEQESVILGHIIHQIEESLRARLLVFNKEKSRLKC